MDSPQGAVVVVTAGQPAERGEVEQHVELVVVLEGSEREGTHTHTQGRPRTDRAPEVVVRAVRWSGGRRYYSYYSYYRKAVHRGPRGGYGHNYLGGVSPC